MWVGEPLRERNTNLRRVVLEELTNRERRPVAHVFVVILHQDHQHPQSRFIRQPPILVSEGARREGPGDRSADLRRRVRGEAEEMRSAPLVAEMTEGDQCGSLDLSVRFGRHNALEDSDGLLAEGTLEPELPEHVYSELPLKRHSTADQAPCALEDVARASVAQLVDRLPEGVLPCRVLLLLDESAPNELVEV